MKLKTVPKSDPKGRKIISLAAAMDSVIPRGTLTCDIYSAITLILAQSFIGHPDNDVRDFCDKMHHAILATNKSLKETSN